MLRGQWKSKTDLYDAKVLKEDSSSFGGEPLNLYINFIFDEQENTHFFENGLARLVLR